MIYVCVQKGKGRKIEEILSDFEKTQAVCGVGRVQGGPTCPSLMKRGVQCAVRAA